VRRYSSTAAEVRESGRCWVESIRTHPRLARRLVRRTSYWVEDPELGDFYPSKWVGFAQMTPSRYEAAHDGAEEGVWFNGTAARQAVEASVEARFGERGESVATARRLRRWATSRLSNVLDGIDPGKWRFVAMDDGASTPLRPQDEDGEGFWSTYQESWDYYEETWETYNTVLYDMCAVRPTHDSLKDVVAKVGIVARAYAAGLERHGDPDGPGAIVGVSRALHRSAGEVDGLLSELRGVAGDDDALDLAGLTEMVRIHGAVQRLTADATRSAVRSWVSKYLHFHAPGVPLFDSRARTELDARYDRRKARNKHFPRPEGADFQYWSFCNRFLSMWLEARDIGLDVSVRRLDQHLLYRADS